MRLPIFTTILLVLLLVLCGTTTGEKKVAEGIEYWTLTDSDLDTDTLINWMTNSPMAFLTGGIETGFDNKPVEFGIFDVRAPVGNELEVESIRVLIYRYVDKSKPYTLAGYTIKYLENVQMCYKYNTIYDRYMLYDYIQGVFEHEKENRIPTIPHNYDSKQQEI